MNLTLEALEELLRKVHIAGYNRGYFDGTAGFTYDEQEQTDDVEEILEHLEEDD